MSKVKSPAKPQQNYQVVNQLQETTPSLLKMPLNSLEVETLIAEEQKLLKLLQSKEENKEHNTVDNLATVLVQALHTKDKDLIYFALSNDVH